MKKILFLFSIFLIFSCSKSDDSNDGKTFDDQLFGKWNLSKEERFNTNSKLVSTVSLKASEHCEYDELNFLPNNTINYLAYYLNQDTDECYSRYTENAYRWKMLDTRRLALYNEESLEFIVTKIDDSEMILERMLSVLERNSDRYKKEGVVRIKVYYQKVK